VAVGTAEYASYQNCNSSAAFAPTYGVVHCKNLYLLKNCFVAWKNAGGKPASRVLSDSYT